MAAPAAAEVPVLAYLVVGLLALVCWIVLRGLRGIWLYTFGAIFDAIGGFKVPTGLFGSVHPLGFLKTLNREILNTIGAAAAKSEHTMGYMFHGVAMIQGWIARELVGLAVDVYAWADWFQHSHLPRWLKAAIYAAVPPLLIARLVRAAIDARLPHLLRTTVINTTHSVTHTVVRVVRATAGAVAIPPWVIRLPWRIGHVERQLPGVWRRLRRLEKYLGATGAVALVTAAIAKLGLQWIRCANVTKAGRAACRTDGSLLDSLLADTLAIVSVMSVVEFADELRAIEEEALRILAAGIREWPS